MKKRKLKEQAHKPRSYACIKTLPSDLVYDRLTSAKYSATSVAKRFL